MSVRFTVPGVPQGKARPRFGNGHTYTPSKTVMYENLIRACYRRAAGRTQPLDGPVAISVAAYFPIPKSTGKKLREKMKNREIRPTAKPDVDNVVKAVCDALNGAAYKDDSSIVSVHAYKFYGDDPRLEIIIFAADRDGKQSEESEQ